MNEEKGLFCINILSPKVLADGTNTAATLQSSPMRCSGPNEQLDKEFLSLAEAQDI
jgi:hypothetical protein